MRVTTSLVAGLGGASGGTKASRGTRGEELVPIFPKKCSLFFQLLRGGGRHKAERGGRLGGSRGRESTLVLRGPCFSEVQGRGRRGLGVPSHRGAGRSRGRRGLGAVQMASGQQSADQGNSLVVFVEVGPTTEAGLAVHEDFSAVVESVEDADGNLRGHSLATEVFGEKKGMFAVSFVLA